MNTIKKKIINLYKLVKNFDYKQYASTNKQFLVFVITALINSTVLRFFTVHNYFAIKPFIADLSCILLLGSFVYLLKPKNQFKYILVISFLFTLVCIVNSLYYTYYMSFASFSLIAVSLSLVDVGDAVVKNVLQFKDFLFLWQPIFMIVLHNRFNKIKYYQKPEKNDVELNKDSQDIYEKYKISKTNQNITDNIIINTKNIIYRNSKLDYNCSNIGRSSIQSYNENRTRASSEKKGNDNKFCNNIGYSSSLICPSNIFKSIV